MSFSFRSEENIRTVAMAVGEVLEIEDDVLDLDPYKRVRVLLDINKPLRRYQMVKINDDSIEILFKYERLPYFCFWCGRISHAEKECHMVSD